MLSSTRRIDGRGRRQARGRQCGLARTDGDDDVLAVCALGVSGLSFYRSYIYTKQQLDITVTEVSYITNQGELYMTVAFANGGNRDAALLRVEPALWAHRTRKRRSGYR